MPTLKFWNFFFIFLSFCVRIGVDGLKMVKKTPGKGPGCFKYAKFLIFEETLQPQNFVPGMCKIAHNLTLKQHWNMFQLKRDLWWVILAWQLDYQLGDVFNLWFWKQWEIGQYFTIFFSVRQFYIWSLYGNLIELYLNIRPLK